MNTVKTFAKKKHWLKVILIVQSLFILSFTYSVQATPQTKENSKSKTDFYPPSIPMNYSYLENYPHEKTRLKFKVKPELRNFSIRLEKFISIKHYPTGNPKAKPVKVYCIYAFLVEDNNSKKEESLILPPESTSIHIHVVSDKNIQLSI